MPKVVFIEADGSRIEADASVGDSLMSTALNAGVLGIDGQCGGCCTCATCHCFVSEEWKEHLSDLGEDENELLEMTTTDRESGSRLSCQINITDQLDGLVVRLPESQ